MARPDYIHLMELVAENNFGSRPKVRPSKVDMYVPDMCVRLGLGTLLDLPETSAHLPL